MGVICFRTTFAVHHIHHEGFVAVLSCLVAAAKAGNYAAAGLGYAGAALAAPAGYAGYGYGGLGYAAAPAAYGAVAAAPAIGYAAAGLAAPGYLGYGVASPYDYAGQVYPA